MICTSCGEAIGTNDRFCSSCGAPHAAASVSAVVPPPPPSPSPAATPAASVQLNDAPLDASALVDLGHRYADGIGVQKSPQEAARYYFEAARQGNAEGQFFLGLSLETGSGVYLSSEEALRWIRLSAEQGYAPAQGTLGIYYRDGKGVPQSYTEALRWLQLAANQGATPAQRFLGALYFYGRGTERNPQEAIRLTRLAAEKRDAGAQSQLAFFLSQTPNSTSSVQEIPHWYLLAAEQGHVAAQASIGMYYEDGKGVPQSYTEAVRWYRMAAEKGNAIAQVCLAECYLTGRGVDTSIDEAERLFRAAAAQDDPDGKRRLAQLLEARAIASRQTAPPQPDALIPSAPPAPIPPPAASPVATLGVVLGAQDKAIAPNAPRIETPTYGFTVKDEPGTVSLYVPERKRPHKTVSQFGNGCAMAFVLVILVPIAGWIGYMAGDATGMVLGGGLMIGLIALLSMHEVNRQKKIQAPFDPVFVIVDRENITINGKAYARSHAREWTTRWTNATSGSVVAVGQPSFVAGAMIGQAIGQQMQKKMAEHSYEVTFDYGNQQVRVAGGMTEAMAGAFMEAITQALIRVC